MNEGDFSDVKQEYLELKSQFRELNERRLEVRKLEAKCKSHAIKIQQKTDALQQLTNSDHDVEEVREINDGLHEMVCSFPAAPSNLLLRLIIGELYVTLPNKDDRVMYKKQYEKFKMVNVVCMFILSVVALVFSNYALPTSLVHMLSVWYYFTATLRELVLISNGSRIKVWWLIHHYFSIAIAALLLTWPPGECYQAFRTQLLIFTCCLSFVMGLQFRYQQGKLYREVAMGVKHHMSVSQGMKISTIKQLLFCLIGVYVFQLYNGLSLMRLYFSTSCADWQPAILGVMFIVVALMNCSTLSVVIYGKTRKPAAVEKHKSF